MTELTIEDAQTRAPVRLTGQPQGDITGGRFDAGADLAAFTVVSDTSPADVFVAGGDWLRAQDWVADDQVAVMGGSDRATSSPQPWPSTRTSPKPASTFSA